MSGRGAVDRLAVGAAMAVCLIALVVVSGRVFDIDALQSFLPGAIGMKLVAATAFFLSAAAVMVQASKRSRIEVASFIVAAAVLVLGLTSLVQDISGHDLSIDRMWMREAPGAIETVHPGRMATNTAVAFVCLGTALILSRSRSRARSVIARLALLIVVVIASEVLIGYVFSSAPVRRMATVTPMALPTAINFALLAFATARLRRDEWPMSLLTGQSAAGSAARNLIPAAVLITLVFGWLRLRGQELGWYGIETGTAIYAVMNILSLWSIILFTTSRLHRNELAREQDHEGIRRALAAQDVIGAASREADTVQRAIAEESRTLVGGAGAAVAILDGGHLAYRATCGSASVLENLTVDAAQSFAGVGLLENRQIIIDDLSSATDVDESVRERMGSVSVAAVPLRSGDILLGSIIVFAEPGQILTANQVNLLRVIANASAAALVQAHQFDRRKALLLEQAGELALLQEQFTVFMANIPAAAFIKDEQGHYVYGNAALTRFLGRALDDVLGFTDQEILSPAQLTILREGDSDINRPRASGLGPRMAAGPRPDSDGRVIRFDDSPEGSFWLLLRFPISVQGGRRLLAGVAVDITEQKRAEHQIGELNASLELRVAARTAELEHMNEELEAFSYSVSHDLRAPLRAVSGYSRILEEDFAATLDDEAKRFLATIRGEAQRMGNLIDDLLAFSRIGRQSIAPTELDVAQLAGEVFQEVQRQRPDRTLELVCGGMPPALADRSTIRQVLVNLLSNAAKYAKKDGAIRVEMGATSDTSFNTYWIRDKGVGFDMRYADKLFGVFQRLHSSEEFEGTGVGLAIVARIIARHGGRVWGEGVVGEGASFYFTLPTLDSNFFDATAPPGADSNIPSAGELRESVS